MCFSLFLASVAVGKSLVVVVGTPTSLTYGIPTLYLYKNVTMENLRPRSNTLLRSFSIVHGELPLGLALDASTGVIGGRATGLDEANREFHVAFEAKTSSVCRRCGDDCAERCVTPDRACDGWCRGVGASGGAWRASVRS